MVEAHKYIARAWNTSSDVEHFTYVAQLIAIVQRFDREGLCQVQ